MIMELLSVDGPCAEVVIDAWKTMIATTAKLDKTRPFSNLEDYVDYRIIDTGAPFVDTLMRFGLAILLTAEEERYLAPIVKPCYAALGLANDYFSFDVEWEEFQSASSGESTMTNLVWLFMQWHQVDVQEAKRCVRKVTNQYEDEYRQRVEALLAKEGKGNDHPGLCDEASVLLERDRKESREENKDREAARDIPTEDIARRRSDSDVRSSISSAPSDDGEPWSPEQIKLGDEYLLAPAEYISSLPSKGVREAFIDALNVWIMLPDRDVTQLKSIAQTLHIASLILHVSLESLASQLGEHFDIRDDYKNLTEEYTGQKGFCEDLDEGKFSFPLIHALSSRPKTLQLRGILQRSRIAGGLDISLKQCVLDHIHQAGSMEYTEKTLSVLMDRINDSLQLLERQSGSPNWILRLLLHRLKG
ncbi:hypothetical protein CFD26_101005 [Aspergillus turcosus]|uniref:Uncharacterized protein n=1 Tax=Aspergillus turcosus TaxID=1245748 RepID=A0A421D0P8_9EURO|nr:hypothetical protein CFD26_101005 [Aspergillus turcosus]